MLYTKFTRLPEVVEWLKKSKEQIFVWVVVRENKRSILMRIGYTEALEWCITCADREMGLIPFCRNGNGDVFLGIMPLDCHK